MRQWKESPSAPWDKARDPSVTDHWGPSLCPRRKIYQSRLFRGLGIQIDQDGMSSECPWPQPWRRLVFQPQVPCP